MRRVRSGRCGKSPSRSGEIGISIKRGLVRKTCPLGMSLGCHRETKSNLCLEESQFKGILICCLSTFDGIEIPEDLLREVLHERQQLIRLFDSPPTQLRSPPSKYPSQAPRPAPPRAALPATTAS